MAVLGIKKINDISHILMRTQFLAIEPVNYPKQYEGCKAINREPSTWQPEQLPKIIYRAINEREATMMKLLWKLFGGAIILFITIGTAHLAQADNLGCTSPFFLIVRPGSSYNFSGDTTGNPMLADQYSCSSWPEAGPEAVYQIHSTAIHGDLSATLTNLTSDLDIFIVEYCDSDYCLAYGDDSAALQDAPPGNYYIVIDGFGSDEFGARGPYTLAITSKCSDPVPLYLGVPYSSETNGGPPANVSSYNCSEWDESGPEVIHTVTTSKTGILRAELSDLEADLDVYILSSCEADSCLAFGNYTAEYPDAAPGTYYIIVDGFRGAQGGYTLTVNNISCENIICYDGNDCTEDYCDPQTGTCVYPMAPAGTLCGDPSNTDCTNPDTCNGAGQCLANNTALTPLTAPHARMTAIRAPTISATATAAVHT
jgi:hypothetical protein